MKTIAKNLCQRLVSLRHSRVAGVLWIGCLLLAWLPGAWAVTPARVQSVGGRNGSHSSPTTTITLTLDPAPADGNTLVAIISTAGTTTERATSITQTGATWSRIVQVANAGGGGTTVEIWSASGVSGATAGLTINLASTTAACAIVAEYSGLWAASANDKSASATGNSTTAATGTTTTTSQADELWLGGISLRNGGYSLTDILNSFKSFATTNSSAGVASLSTRLYALERIVTATGTASSGGTVSSSAYWSGAIATFKAKALPSVTTWPTSSAIYAGQTLASSTLSGGVATPAGSFAWTTPSTVPSAGTTSQSVTFTPTDTTHYATTSYTVNVSVETYALGATNLLEGATAGTNSALLTGSATNRAPWTASASASWLHVATSSGSGIGAIVFSFDANIGGMRTGTVTVAGQSLTVCQAGGAYLPASPIALGITGLASPGGVAVDASGNVYFADTANNAIKKWNPGNNTTTTLVATDLNAPRGVAVDDSGKVYIADTGNSAVKRWNPADSSVTTLVGTGLSAPRGVALGGGNLYLTDSGNNALKCWNLTNSTLTTLISTGLDSPGGVAVDLFGNVYVADTGNGVIKKWAVTDGSVSTLAASGLSAPEGLAVDACGNLYVADSGNQAIKRWNLASGAATVLSASGCNAPGGVAVDAAGSLFIADTGNHVLKSLPHAFVATTDRVAGTEAGSGSLPVVVPATQSLSGPFTPTSDQSWLTIAGVTGGVVSFTFTANTGPTRSANFTLLGRTIALKQAGQWAVGTSELLEGPAGGSDSVTLAAPDAASWTCTANSSWLHIVTASGSGSTNVVFTFDDNSVGGLNRTGSLTVAGMTVSVTQAGSTYAPANQLMTLISTNIGIQGTLALDTHDNVYVADTYGWQIMKWDASSNVLNAVLKQIPPYYRCLAVDGAENVFFYEITVSSVGLIQKWDPATDTTNTLATIPSGPGFVIWDMVVDRFGNLYTASDDLTVKKWEASSGSWTTLFTMVNDPYGLAVDAAGNLYIAIVYPTPAIWKWTAADGSLAQLPIPDLPRPECLTVDGSGNVFFLNYPSIKKWSATSSTVSTVCLAGDVRTMALDSLGNLYAYTLTATQSMITVWPKAYLEPAPRIQPAGGGDDPMVILPTAAKLTGPFAPVNSEPGWLTVSSVSNGVVNLSIPPNSAFSPRRATLTVLSNAISITQTATPPAAVALGTTHLAVGPASGTENVLLSVIPASQSWVNSANDSWLHLVTTSGTGSANVVFTFDANSGDTRTGTLTIAGLTFTVTQAGAGYVSANPMAVVLPTTGVNAGYRLAVDGADDLHFNHYYDVETWHPASGLVSTQFTRTYTIAALASDTCGNPHFYTSDEASIKAWQPGGGEYTLVSSNLHLGGYESLAVDRSGNVYTVVSDGLQKWVAASNSVISLSTNLGFGASRYVAADITGNIYIGKSYTNKFLVWRAADESLSALGPWSLTSIGGLAVDGSGNVYGIKGASVTMWNPISSSETLLASSFHDLRSIAVDSSRNVFVTDYTTGVGIAVTARLRAFVDTTPLLVSSSARSHSLPSVLPSTEPLCAPFAPASDQSWLTITTATNGVVSFACTTNSTGAERVAHITLFGQSITVNQSVNVIKTTPTITAWPTASGITYGQTLASSTLTGGAASVPGTFAWTAPATKPSAGTASQSVTFTPTDTLNYNPVGGASSVTVATKPLGVTGLVAADKFYDGTVTASLSGTPALVSGDIVSGDDVSLASGGTPVGAFADREIGSGKTVSYASGLTLQGTTAGNYCLTGTATPAAILATKTDTGMTTISVANSQSFDLMLNAGTLVANNPPAEGSINGSGTIQVNSGATLGGNGRVGQVRVNSSGTIAPGTSVGTLNTESQTWAGGGTYAWELADTTAGGPGVGWDWINITGDLTITATNQPPNDATKQFSIAISGAGANFNSATTDSWIIATASGAVNSFNAGKFTLTTSGFTPALDGGGFSVVLRDRSVVLVFTPQPPPCANTTTPSFAVVVSSPGATNMQMTFVNASGLSSVQALAMENCAITGTAYGSGDTPLGAVGPLSLTARTALPANTVKTVLTAAKLTNGVPAEVNVLAIDLCGRGVSFDPVITTLEVAEGGRVQQRFEGLLSAEHYLQVVNGTPGLARLEVVLNGHKFRLNSLTNGQTVNADLSAAMNEGNANVVVLTGYGEPGASALVLITDSAGGELVQLSEVVELTLARASGQVMVTWPTTLAGWQLQASESLTGGWQEVAVLPVAADGRLTVTLPTGAAARFFRLWGTQSAIAASAALTGGAKATAIAPAPTQPQSKPQSATTTDKGIAW